MEAMVLAQRITHVANELTLLSSKHLPSASHAATWLPVAPQLSTRHQKQNAGCATELL
jgi:hypothetical protein